MKLHLHFHSHDGSGHTRDHADHPGHFHERELPLDRNFKQRAFTVGVGGPVGSGKTALMLQLCKRLREKHNIAAVTNDIFTKEDGEFLTRNEALPAERIMAVETGGGHLAAHYSRELADYTIYVIDVSGGDKIPRKGGPGITQADLLVINKTDLAEAVGADLAVMERDAKLMRGDD